MHKYMPKKVVVYGCGNMLLGDDGFGPAVIAELEQKQTVPGYVHLEDVGTGIREYLVDYLLAPSCAPELLIILDAVQFGDRRPGEVFVITPETIPAKKIHDFSLHQFPTVNLLRELAEHSSTRVEIIAAQVHHIPTEIRPGLSSPMQAAVTTAAEKVRQIILHGYQQVYEETVS